MVNAKFGALRVAASVNPEFAKPRGVSVYPTTFLGGSDGKIHGFSGGYLNVDQFKENASKSLASIPPAAPPPLLRRVPGVVRPPATRPAA